MLVFILVVIPHFKTMKSYLILIIDTVKKKEREFSQVAMLGHTAGKYLNLDLSDSPAHVLSVYRCNYHHCNS